MPKATKVDEIVGSNIRWRRIEAGLTQAQFGASLPVPISSQQVSEYERGNDQVGANRLVDIAALFKCHITELFEGVAEATQSIAQSRRMVVAMHHYTELPYDVQESLRELMKALAIALGKQLKTTERNNV